MAQRPGPQLIPGFPNEITDMVLEGLSFHDLLTSYFVSNAWKDHINGNGEFSKHLFRLPRKRRTADRAERTEFVGDLWEVTYNMLSNADTSADLWKHIDINPLFDTHSGIIDQRGFCMIHPSTEIDPSLLPDLPFDLHDCLEEFWRSMFVTYPPIAQVQCFHRNRYSIMPQPMRSDMLIERTGMTIGYLRSRIVDSDKRRHHEHVWLWTGMAYADLHYPDEE
jgi:hypothetical protein